MKSAVSAKSFFVLGLFAILATLSAGPVPAQVVTGTIHGNVLDSTSGVVPGAEVSAARAETGLSRTVVTNDVGFYSFEALQPGVYTITVEMPGFKKFIRQGVKLSVSQSVRVDVQLEIGEVSDSVTVQADAVMVDTRTAEISGLIDDQRITDLPLSGRNVMALASLLPGVSTVFAPQVQTDSRGGPRLTVHGSRPNQNYITLNGTYFMHPSRNTGMNPPPPDAVREFRIKTNNFSAAEGRNPGSNISVVTRAGTNDFHGSLWEFHRNDNLNARSFFEVGKPNRIMNQFGAAAGGPILKDRAHVFGSYEAFRDRPQPSTTDAFPPTAAERAGDFSHVNKQLTNPYTGEAFPNNEVPTALFDPVSLNLLELMPLPNTPDGRLVTNNPAPNNNDLFMIRNDFRITEQQNFYWHYYYNRNERPPRVTGDIPGYMEQQDSSNFHNFGINHTYVLSPAILNTFTFGFNSSTSTFENLIFRSTESLGMDFPNYVDHGAPRIRVPGRFANRPGSNTFFDSDTYTVHEAMSWMRGDHTMKFGVEFFRLSFFQTWGPTPQFTFNGARSGDAMLDFLLGAWRDVNIDFGRRLNDTIQPWYWSFYFQDEWRVQPRLTLTLGVRYELPSPWNDRRELGLSSIVFPIDESNRTKAPLPDAPPGYLFANFDLPQGLVRADKNNFAPRLGFAYDLTGNGRTSLRGGGGVFYDTGNADTLAQVNPPFVGRRRFVNGQLGAPNAGIVESLPPVNPTPESAGFDLPINPFSTDQGLRTPYFYHWNLGIQRQLAQDILFSVDYVGKIGKKMLAFWPWNPAIYIPGTDADGNPLSTLANVNSRVRFGQGFYGVGGNLLLSSMFDSNYHGMDLMLNKRFSEGYSVLTSYTWSKAIDESSTFTLGGGSANPFDPKGSERGPASFDRRHILTFSALWSPLTGGVSDGFLSHLVSGWTFSPIFRYSSGSPLTFSSGEDQALSGTGGQRPDLLRNPKKDHSNNQSKIDEWFDTTAFELPAIGTFGNSGKGIIPGPSDINWDLAVLRDFSLGGFLSEESRVQFRAELFNALNHTNFGNPNTTLTSSRFGEIRSAGSGREVQFGLKLLW